MVNFEVWNDSVDVDLADPKFKLLEIVDEKLAQCPYCGIILEIPPRTVGMTELRQIEIRKRAAIFRRNVLGSPRHYAINARVGRCGNCGNPILLIDKYTFKV